MVLDKRGHKCEIRVSASEKQKILELASQQGLSLSATIRQAIIQKHSFLTYQELNALLGQIRDHLSMIYQTLNNFNGSVFAHPSLRQLQTDVQQLKETIAELEKRF